MNNATQKKNFLSSSFLKATALTVMLGVSGAAVTQTVSAEEAGLKQNADSVCAEGQTVTFVGIGPVSCKQIDDIVKKAKGESDQNPEKNARADEEAAIFTGDADAQTSLRPTRMDICSPRFSPNVNFCGKTNIPGGDIRYAPPMPR